MELVGELKLESYINTMEKMYRPLTSAAILGFLIRKDRFMFMAIVLILKTRLLKNQWKNSKVKMYPELKSVFPINEHTKQLRTIPTYPRNTPVE